MRELGIWENKIIIFWRKTKETENASLVSIWEKMFYKREQQRPWDGRYWAPLEQRKEASDAVSEHPRREVVREKFTEAMVGQIVYRGPCKPFKDFGFYHEWGGSFWRGWARGDSIWFKFNIIPKSLRLLCWIYIHCRICVETEKPVNKQFSTR